ncbi:MAG: response regulator transcription factor [Anaerolineae bacterium]|nr:response regulator transcription factor [Anaerolineae bacterium]
MAELRAARILVIDDEEHIRTSLKELLTRDGYEVFVAESGEVALKLIDAYAFDLALIDLKLGGIGGIEVLTALRQKSPQTIAIVLTAHASLETAVAALRQGAHDYLFKPCKPSELRESIRRGLLGRQEQQRQDLLRQIDQIASNLEDIRTALLSQAYGRPALGAQQRFLQRGGVIIDLLSRVVTVDGHLLDLSPTEFEILAYLVRRAPQVVSPQELIREVQGYESDQWEASEIIRQHIYRIRQRIKEASGRTDVLRTVRGVGYAIT